MSASRQALLLVLPLMWCAVLGSAAGAIYAKYRARELFMQLTQLRTAREALDDDWGRLQLEQSAWSAYTLVERVASDRLHMSTPDPRTIEIIAP
ncbi:MAG TPA: cell division protein FtsL [Steroidobacteraceae bacterium]|nr:cell division protein FtsL [Steroidobacteraceae bacterium]